MWGLTMAGFWPYLLLLTVEEAAVVVGAEDCTFTIPSSSVPGSCVLYDLTTVASQGPYKLTDTDSFEIVFTLCGNISGTSLPKQCSSVSTADGVAYQYNSSSCYKLGSNKKESTYTVSY